MTMDSRPYAFISYSHDDREFAARLSARLHLAGLSHFRDTDQIAWGEYIPDRIHSALNQATHLIVLISPGSEQSQWVSYEMGFARGRNIVLVPYLLHPRMKVPGFLENIRYLCTPEDEESFIKSLQAQSRQLTVLQERMAVKGTTKVSNIQSGLSKIRSEHPRVRQDGIELLVEAKAVEQLMPLFGHRDRQVRRAAAEALARLRHEGAIDYLIAGLGYTGRRSRAEIIPDVEDLFFHYGERALLALLEKIPESLGGRYGGAGRWTRALANAATTKTAGILLTKAKETGRGEFLQSALKVGRGFRKADLLAAIESCIAKAYDKKDAKRDIAAWLVESKQKDANWTRQLVRDWLTDEVREYPTQLTYWYGVTRLARSALSMGALRPTELRQIANLSQNKGLTSDLIREGENWKEQSAS